MNVSFDLETLGNTSQAPIIQIGAVLFDSEGNFLKTYNKNCNFESIPDGFHVDYSTLAWWFGQLRDNPSLDQVVRSSWVTDWTSHKSMLDGFRKWVSECTIEWGELSYWSHATFDPPILMNNFRVAGFGDNVIPFRRFFDIRTLTELTGKKVKIQRDGHHHSAIDDAKTQAKYIADCFAHIKKNGICK